MPGRPPRAQRLRPWPSRQQQRGRRRREHDRGEPLRRAAAVGADLPLAVGDAQAVADVEAEFESVFELRFLADNPCGRHGSCLAAPPAEEHPGPHAVGGGGGKRRRQRRTRTPTHRPNSLKPK